METSNKKQLSTEDIAAYLEGKSSLSDFDMLQAMISNPELGEIMEALSELDEIDELTELKDINQINEL